MDRKHPFELAVPVRPTDHVLRPLHAPVHGRRIWRFRMSQLQAAAPVAKLMLKEFPSRVRFVYSTFSAGGDPPARSCRRPRRRNRPHAGPLLRENARPAVRPADCTSSLPTCGTHAGRARSRRRALHGGNGRRDLPAASPGANCGRRRERRPRDAGFLRQRPHHETSFGLQSLLDAVSDSLKTHR